MGQGRSVRVQRVSFVPDSEAAGKAVGGQQEATPAYLPFKRLTLEHRWRRDWGWRGYTEVKMQRLLPLPSTPLCR